MNEYFPELAEKGNFMEMLGRGKKRLLYEIDEILDKKDHGEEINKIDRYIAEIKHVYSFTGFGDDKQHDKDFESLCAYMQKETTRNVKNLTVMEFYSLLTNMNTKKNVKTT